ncbi:MAG TPA: ABC transporter permease [Candidatus Acidoferrales bacterium]|nr:ABC transporter permease [Candidatus Acidoferrales bacterium]
MTKLRAIFKRLSAIFRRDQHDADLAAELESHLQFHIEDNLRAGMTPEEARRQALIKLGGLDQTKESVRNRRGLPWLDSLLQDTRFALRMLRKNPGFTTVAVLTLALGIGANTAIFSVIDATMLNHLPYKDPARLAMIWGTNLQRGVPKTPVSPGDYFDWKRENNVFADMAASYDTEPTLTGSGSPQMLLGYSFSANYFSILGVAPELGRAFSSEEDSPGGPNVVVLSDSLWRNTFHANPQLLGQSITLDGKPSTVIGVMPRDFDYPTGVQVWMPAALPSASASDYQRHYIRVIGRLKRGVSMENAQTQMMALSRQIDASHPGTDAGNGVKLISLRGQLAGDIETPLFILMGAVAAVLLIACANLVNLLLARFTSRHKEITVRAALGAGRTRLARQFLTESVLLSLLGGTLGVVFAMWSTRFLVSIFPNDIFNLSIPRVTQIPINGPMLLFALIATVATGIVFGAAPALQSARAEAVDVLRGSGHSMTSGRRSSHFRNALVVVEVTLSLVLLAGAGLLLESFNRITHARLGFQPDHLLGVEVLLAQNRYPADHLEKRRAFAQEVLAGLQALPGVKSVAATSTLPLTGFWSDTSFYVEGQPASKPNEVPEADLRTATPGYFSTMQIPLVRGRVFTDADNDSSARAAIIDETLARRYFGANDPIGMRLNLGATDHPEWWQVVGEVKNVKAFGFERPDMPTIYRPYLQVPGPLLAFTISTNVDPRGLLSSAKEIIWRVDKDQPIFNALPMTTLAAQSSALRRISTALVAAFAILALILAALGIYGVMSYSVGQRTQEIGIRMALGAQPRALMRSIVGQGIRLAMLGVAFGVLAALALMRLIEGMLFGVNASDPLALTGAAGLVIIVAQLACYIPARRAMRVDPMVALRHE